MSTGKTSETAQGAQPRAKKTPKVKAPMKAEYSKRPMEMLTSFSIKPFHLNCLSTKRACDCHIDIFGCKSFDFVVFIVVHRRNLC